MSLTEPYDRERRLMPVLVDGTRRGVRIDRGKLLADAAGYETALLRVTETLCNRLDAPGLNVGSPTQLGAALERSDVLCQPLPRTPNGKPSTAKEGLIDCIEDKEFLNELLYASSLSTCLGTFIYSWITLSQADGRVHPEWNQVRDTERYTGGKGTKTGRMSSSKPNFQNVPNEFRQDIPEGFPALPLMRQYCLPEEGCIWVKRDWSGQEIRILAHFEDGELLEAYKGNPDLDPHEMVRQMIKTITGVLYDRKDVKITGFSIVYGSGIGGVASQLHKPYNEARDIKDAFLTALPGVKSLNKGIQKESKLGNPITTWGGRPYQVEPSKIIKGRKMDFYYKLLNYLIQGSAADQAKQVVSDWYYDYRREDELYLAMVHDDINISVPEKNLSGGMDRLREAMEQDLFDVPMRSEGFVGDNWYDLEVWNDGRG